MTLTASQDAGNPVSRHLASPRIIALLAAMVALDSMAIDLYASAFPTIGATFGVSDQAVSATMSIFFLGAAIGQLFLGPILDRYGRKRPLVAGMVMFAVGSLICAVSPGYAMLMFGRLIQAFGVAAALVGPRAVLADLYQSTEMARVMSIIIQIMMIAPIVSPIIGAFIMTHMGWRFNFVLLTIVATALALVMAWLLPETLPPEHRTKGSPLAAMKGYRSVASRTDFVWLVVATSCAMGMMYAFLSASPFVFISDYGVTPLSYSIIVGAMAFAVMVVGGFNIALLPRFGERGLMLAGMWILLASAVLLAWMSYGGTVALAVYIALSGLGVAALGLILGNVTTIAMERSGSYAGIGSAALGVIQSLFSAAAGLVLALTGTDRTGMMVAITLFAAGSLAAVYLGLRRKEA